MATLTIEPREQARIDKLGLLVTELVDGSYVVRHPKLKRAKREGGNLSALITAIEMDLEAKKPETKPKAGKASLPGLKARDATKAVEQPKTNGSTGGTTIAEAIADDKARDKAKRDRPKAVAAKRVVATKQKRQQSDWKTYAVGKLILQNASMTPDEIITLCKEKKIETKPGTVYGLHRYFNLCIRIMADLAEEKTP